MSAQRPACAAERPASTSPPGAKPERSLITLDMTISRAGLRLAVAGELDLSTNDRLSGALRRLDPPFRSVLDLTEVRFADSSGLQPVVEAARRHQATSSLTIDGLSEPVRRIFDLLHVAYQPNIDVAAWDAAGNVWSAPG